ncbi:MAG: hypothetical protein M1593_02990 [Candidatus Thermoplasmatota archaeon]|nr:hypothetical protein [Candidatus Thermoplasmatota archaeon]MCL5667970.1 hypothetical protein [Candidatus Thermoplasmatota archaeon]
MPFEEVIRDLVEDSLDLDEGMVVVTGLQPVSLRSVDVFEFENGLTRGEREYNEDILLLEPEGKS